MTSRNIFLASVIVFFAGLFVVPQGFVGSDSGSMLLTTIAFLFGILAGFYIVVTTTDYNMFKDTVAEETAGWISLYHNVMIYDRRVARKLSGYVERYIQRSYDCEIIEYVRWTRPEFEAINVLVRKLPAKSRLSPVYDEIRDLMEQIVKTRQKLTVLSTQTLSIFQWMVLYILSTLLVLTLYGLRDGNMFFSIATVAISSSVVLVLLLVRDLDLYLWNEKTFGYDIYQNVLQTIGKLPYYPVQTVESGRIKPTEKVYRVGQMLGRDEGHKKRTITVVTQR